MLESLDPSVGLMSDLSLFSSESVLLDLDSNLSFENISWIDEDLFENHTDRYDHTYSQRTEDEETGNRLGQTRSGHDIAAGDNEVSAKEQVNKTQVERDCNQRIESDAFLESKGCSQDTRHTEERNSANSHLSISQGQNPQEVFSESSLSFLLEETCLDYDLNSILDDEFELSNTHRIDHQEPMKETQLTSFDVQSCIPGDDNHSVVTLDTCFDSSLATNEQNYNYLSFNESASDQSSLTNLDLSNAFDSLTRLDMSDSSDWSTLSTCDFSLDWDSNHEPLSLEELFTRTFNEALDKGPSHVPLSQPDFYPDVYSDRTSEFAQWYDTTDSNQGSYSESNGNARSPMLGNSYSFDQQLLGGTEKNTAHVIAENHGKHTHEYNKACVFNVGTPSLTEPAGISSLPPCLTKATSKPVSHANRSDRLGFVRKYQRTSTNTSNVVRNFQCDYADCRKFYAKLSHLKAHLRRHSGERAFKCDWQDCAWQFSRSDELSRHRRSHYGIKPYPCTQCIKRFTRSDHLAKHLKVHERQKYKMMVKGMRKMKSKK